jgi:hypothetical protein
MKCTSATILSEKTPLTSVVISTKAIKMRRAKGCLDTIGLLRQSVAHTMQGVQ